MNGDTIQLDKNTYAVIENNGNTRIVSTINSNSQETMKNILLKENDIEEIEDKINQHKNDLNLVKINTIYAETLNTFLYIIFIAFGILFKPTNTTQWIALGSCTTLTYIFIKTIGIGMFNTRSKRKKKIKQIKEELPILEELLEKARKELEKIKTESNFTELTDLNTLTTNKPNYSYIYKYDPNNCNLENIPQEEINKEVNVMKLSRIKRNPFQKKELIK